MWHVTEGEFPLRQATFYFCCRVEGSLSANQHTAGTETKEGQKLVLQIGYFETLHFGNGNVTKKLHAQKRKDPNMSSKISVYNLLQKGHFKVCEWLLITVVGPFRRAVCVQMTVMLCLYVP